MSIGDTIYAASILGKYTSWGEKMRLKFFVDSCISQLGATSTTGVRTKGDAAFIIRNYEDYSKDYEICRYYNISSIKTVTHHLGKGGYTVEKNISDEEYYIGQLAVFKEYLEKWLGNLNELNNKRMTKKNPMPPIMVIYEDEWIDFLMKKDKDPIFHENRKKIAKELIEKSTFVGGDEKRIADIYESKLEGREFDL